MIKEVLVDKVKENRVDELMGLVMDTTNVPLSKISENYYEFGTKKIYVKLDLVNDEVIVRDRGGKYIEMSEYVKAHEKDELARLARGESRATMKNDAIGKV